MTNANERALQITVSPDINIKYLPGWFTFNVWLQKQLGLRCHFRVFEDFTACRQALSRDEIDLIYANPYDAALLLREKGFLPVARPLSQSDEAVLAVSAESPHQRIEDLPAGIKVASAGDPEIDMICRIMLEPADLTITPEQTVSCDNYVLVAKSVLNGKADVGFFNARAYDDLSAMVRKQLRVLLRSQIHVLHHLLLCSPRQRELAGRIQSLLVAQNDDGDKQKLLAEIGLTGWQPLDREEAEFMIDMMDTLSD